MFNKHAIRIAFFCAGVAVVSATPVSAQNLTVDQIIAKNIEAHGGMAKIKAAKTMRITGKMTLGPGIEAPIVMEQKRPELSRMDITLQGMTAVQAYDGKVGWSINPFGGKKDPEVMGEDDRKEMAEQADFDGPLVDYKEKGNKVELVGKEPVDGTDAYKIKVTLKSGDTRYFYLDTDSFLEIKEESKRTIRGTERESETSIGDYKDEGGLMLAHSMEMGQKGSPQKQQLTLEKVEINPAIDDSRFKMPEVKKPVAAAEEKKTPEVKK
jgi:outer membrane lipoprotein-sorting protein